MRSFYENIFEWKTTAASNKNIVLFHLNGFLLSLCGREDLAKDAKLRARGEGFKSFTLAYNLKSKEEVDRLLDKLKAKGVDITKEPEETDWGGYSGYISDPENNLWEIAYSPFIHFDELGNVLT